MDLLPVAHIQALLSRATPEELPVLLSSLDGDRRPGVCAACLRSQRRLEVHAAEQARLASLARREWELLDRGLRIVAGVDEVGRGALAGPVTAGACVFSRDVMLEGLDDSKRLTAMARERLHAQIESSAVAVSVGHAQPDEIDALGIGRAIVVAMRRALDGLQIDIEHVLVDGRPVDLGRPSTAIVKGDASVRAIAAAAVYAKVTRDRLMTDLARHYPAYGFDHNKGYGSADHLEAIASLGPSPVHRMSFAPCSQTQLF